MTRISTEEAFAAARAARDPDPFVRLEAEMTFHAWLSQVAAGALARAFAEPVASPASRKGPR